MSHLYFGDLASVRTALSSLPSVDSVALGAAAERNAQLTKPPQALGQLEGLAIWYAGWRGTAQPTITAPQVVIFAGNHGVAARGVSAFPPEVTVQMVANFNAGGAAVNQLARTFGAKLDVVALELERPTDDFTQTAAMTEADLCAALSAGWDAVDPDADLLVTGEMGIGNTTSAAAIAAALFGGGAEAWTGRGTGVDDAALRAKTEIVNEGLARHPQANGDGLEALRCFGGREVAAMAGAILRARHLRIPVILDGFICCAAASALEKAQPGALDHTVAGHLSAETAHRRLLDELGKIPLLSLDMRLGEGSGGTLAIGVLKGAVNCLSGMATFAEAGVSGS
ncbi:nicotinate-nucleotide--dimethylbenzimidazole phosphoribosyltransferase [Meridianimarinicoccus aquatilis]|uniref:Nicotinate-nucleotide--dimethylbenzimidazole phosphoribosyltransferase n=1 Tax=Meridianimarinicoccus aquatilis TaxID=2552766 RepID=A0A4R6B389_9RHOB|nr:nicotinate-nucleotide--dimethylbenzimidazole phosphoribosyltransferase [Fluviibacterium aquatile]QIE42016.1 nicotinate-nucleotide--dimethylbenzimidazole phosphoribosyltransferase [Rhodobacteraceae bacterium SC52]TDL90715.1 nicotinate-nucleotide--dimethylbenzimidazole phosphoribosyltransferase [Fluviibacterium aquatile]